MEISATSAANSVNQPKKSNTNVSANEDLGQDAFMQLLLAQLRNQDPLKPMEDKDFIAQLAQFNSLNQLTQMAATLDNLVKAQSLGQGSALLGKTVRGLADGQVVTGLVSGLQISDGNVVLDVEGQRMSLSDVQSVTETARSDSNDGQSQSNSSTVG